MKKTWIGVVVATCFSVVTEAQPQDTAAAATVTRAEQSAPLALVHTIPLPDVNGWFDHFAEDVQGRRLFLAEEDHKSVEVFDLRTFKSIRRISGFETPHWILYQPQRDELFVTDEDGTVKIFNGKSYRLVETVKLGEGTDCITYNPRTNYLYVAYGGRDAKSHSSSIAIIDTATHKHLGDITIPAARIEGMDVDPSAGRLYVNMTSKEEVGVVDLNKRSLVETWSLDLEADANVPLRLDAANHRLFIATRTPTRFIVINADTGKVISNLQAGLNADDIFYDPANKRVYLSCGEGFTTVYQQEDADHYKFIARVTTGPDARNSFFSPELDLYFVPTVNRKNRNAALLVYRPRAVTVNTVPPSRRPQ
ncbi:MAG TPA: hypothetical protein VKB88_13865 [Bryobacteraceae bacterium]|nr:hypothetical protein [Bryobacteraceae bacterium]